MNLLNKLTKEPLVYFIIIGLLLFLINAFFSDEINPKETILINDVIINQQTKGQANRQTKLNKNTIEKIIDDYISTEIRFREALKLGLDNEDIIVRRRLIQKYDFLDQNEIEQPALEDLKNEYINNASNYYSETSIDIEHIYFDFDKYDFPKKKAEEVYEGFKKRPFTSYLNVGDQFYINKNIFSKIDRQTLRENFGKEFTDTLFTNLKIGLTKPIKSGYGYHLVNIIKIRESERLPFSKVKQELKENWETNQVAKHKKNNLNSLRKKYKIEYDLDEYKHLIN